MNKFKVGDRVNVYHSDEIILGEVIGFDENDSDLVRVKYDRRLTNSWDYFHYKQCRKIVKKKDRKFYNIEAGPLLADGAETQHQFYIGPLKAGVYTLTINAVVKRV